MFTYMIDFTLSKKKLISLKAWLKAKGAQILTPTNDYEMLRFKSGHKVGIIYCNKFGHISSVTPEAKEAIECFLKQKPYIITEKVKRKKKSVLLQSLIKRDGMHCFYCGKLMNDGEESIEHLFSINQGGTNHISNLALAHIECNKLASHKSIVEKVNLREKIQRKIMSDSKSTQKKEEALSLKQVNPYDEICDKILAAINELGVIKFEPGTPEFEYQKRLLHSAITYHDSKEEADRRLANERQKKNDRN